MPADLKLNILKDIRIASPCSVPWDSMQGDDKTRHCDQCNLSVHNFAAMTSAEIEALVLGATGRICGRLYRRADGTILTADCPVGLAAVRAKLRRGAARAVAALGVLISAGVLFAQGKQHPWNQARLSRLEPFNSIYKMLAPDPPAQQLFLSGDICAPSPTPVNAPSTN